jgi:hypothetical protein
MPQERLGRTRQLFEEYAAIEAGVLTEECLYEYVGTVCNALEADGYAVPNEFNIGNLIDALSEVIETGERISEGRRGWYAKAKRVIRGAVSSGVAKLPKVVHRGLRRYHSKQADAAIDSGDKKAFAHHRRKYVQALSREDPAASARAKLTSFHYGEPTPGSKSDIRRTWKSTRRANAEAGWYAKHGSGSAEDLKSKEPTHPGVPPWMQGTVSGRGTKQAK